MDCLRKRIYIYPEEIDVDKNIYPCMNNSCTFYHTYSDKYEIMSNAIYFLKPNKVRELCKDFTVDDIHNIHMIDSNNENNNNENNNFLNSILKIIATTNHKFQDIENIQKIRNKDEYTLFLEIIEILCIHYPTFINENSYIYPTLYCMVDIIDILDKYINTGKNSYKYKYKYKNKYTIKQNIKLCKCSGEDIYTILEKINVKIDKCHTCLTKYKIYKCPLKNIHFPEINVYKSPFTNDYIMIDKNNKIVQLYYACIYLVYERVREIIDKMTNREFMYCMKVLRDKYYFKEITTSMDDKVILLCNNPCSDLSYDKYTDCHLKINDLLFKKHMDTMNYDCIMNNKKISYGNYIFCKNNFEFKLKENGNDVNKYKYLLQFHLKLNLKLKRDTLFLKINANYAITQKNYYEYTVFVELNKSLFHYGLGQYIQISFFKKNAKGQNEKMFYKNYILSSVIKNKIFKQYGDIESCNICLENIGKNKYITPCGHSFHTNCIFDFMKNKNLLYDIEQNCYHNCCKTEGIKELICPVCKFKII
jgi:hypothetical protein